MTFLSTNKLMNRAPDYDSGCFSIAATSYLEKVHGLGTRNLIIHLLLGENDTDCVNDGTGGTGRPRTFTYRNNDYVETFLSSDNNIELYNPAAATKYFKLLIWKGE